MKTKNFTVSSLVKNVLNFVRNLFTRERSAQEILIRYIEKHAASIKEEDWLHRLPTLEEEMFFLKSLQGMPCYSGADAREILIFYLCGGVQPAVSEQGKPVEVQSASPTV